MKVKQEQLIQMFFKRGDLVWYINQSKQVVRAAVETEAQARPGWYYVREHESGHVELVEWVDLELVA